MQGFPRLLYAGTVELRDVSPAEPVVWWGIIIYELDDVKIAEVRPDKPIRDIKMLREFVIGRLWPLRDEYAAVICPRKKIPRRILNEAPSYLDDEMNTAFIYQHHAVMLARKHVTQTVDTLITSVEAYRRGVEALILSKAFQETFSSTMRGRAESQQLFLARELMFRRTRTPQELLRSMQMLLHELSSHPHKETAEPKILLDVHTAVHRAIDAYEVDWAKTAFCVIGNRTPHGRSLRTAPNRGPNSGIFNLAVHKNWVSRFYPDTKA